MNRGLLPGYYDDIPAREYHADQLTEELTLNASVGSILLDQTPRHAMTAHPRLNPTFESKDEDKFDLGSVAHELILGRGGGFLVLDFLDWRTKAAQEVRAKTRAEGLTPILHHQFETAQEMAYRALARLQAIPEARGLLNGASERVLIWRDIGTLGRDGPLCRCMLDAQSEVVHISDVKTTALPLSDFALSSLIISQKYDMKAAFYLRGASAVWPELAGAFKWRWIFVEDHEPFEVRVIEPTGEMLALGDRKAALAIEKWRRCIVANDWPGYEPKITRLDPPTYATQRWLEREMTDPDALAMAVSYDPTHNWAVR